jgi:tetratricopeptide (TPR) repeat protein
MSETGQGLSIRAQKVRGIFNEFDSNRDGCLNRDEMAALVIAVNPRVKFSKDQIEAILDEVFRTYGEFIEGQKGLSFEGLLRTYDDGAGDVDRDFDALGLHLASASIAGDGNDELQTAETKINSRVDLGGSGSRLPTPSIADEASGNVVKRSSIVGAWARSPNHGITYDETWGFIEELELRLKEYEAKQQQKQRDEKKGGGGLNGVDTAAAAADWEDGVDKGEGFDRRRREDELGSESAAFKKRLVEFREKAGKVQTPEQAFDRHMAMGRCLLEHHWYEEAIKSFDLAERLKPQDVRAPFLMGNAYYSLGKYVDAEKKYRVALEAGEANSVQWKDLLPQVSPVEFFVFLSFCLRTLMNR